MFRFPTHLETHHIVKQGRSDEPCNLLRVCCQCHRVIEGEKASDELGPCPPLKLEHVLWCKKQGDPQEYDRKRLAQLKHMALPSAKKPPQRYIDEFLFHQSGPYGSG